MFPRILCLMLLIAPVAAADQIPGRLAFSATLDSIRINGRPDEVVTRQFRLSLDANQPATRFRAKVEDWWRSEDGRQSFYAEAGTIRRSCARWVDINPVELVVEPGGTLIVRVTVSIPHEVPNGGFWCALTVDEVPDPETVAAGVGVTFLASVSTGIFVYLGDVQRAASILDIDLDGANSAIRLRNDGNTPLGVEGRIDFVRPGSGDVAATSALARYTLLPEPSNEGRIIAPLPPADELPDGTYVMRAILDFGVDHLIGAEREIVLFRQGARDGDGGTR